MKGKILQTIIETPEFIKKAKSHLDETSRRSFIDFIAKNPLAGNLIPETGGARKIRWQGNEHQGKSGGVRIIYYYHNLEMPIFLFTLYKKNQKENLTGAEKNTLKNIINMIIKKYKENKND